MKRAILTLLFLLPLPSCGFDEGGELSECEDEVCYGPDAGPELDAGALRLGPPRVKVDLSRSVPTHLNQLPDGEGDVAERDQAPEPDLNTSPDELPVFEWEPGTALACGDDPDDDGPLLPGVPCGGLCCNPNHPVYRPICGQGSAYQPACCYCTSTDALGKPLCGGANWCNNWCHNRNPETGVCEGGHGFAGDPILKAFPFLRNGS